MLLNYSTRGQAGPADFHNQMWDHFPLPPSSQHPNLHVPRSQLWPGMAGPSCPPHSCEGSRDGDWHWDQQCWKQLQRLPELPLNLTSWSLWPCQGPSHLPQPPHGSPWHPILPDTSSGTALESCLAHLAQGLFGNKSGVYLTVALLATFCWVCWTQLCFRYYTENWTGALSGRKLTQIDWKREIPTCKAIADNFHLFSAAVLHL